MEKIQSDENDVAETLSRFNETISHLNVHQVSKSTIKAPDLDDISGKPLSSTLNDANSNDERNQQTKSRRARESIGSFSSLSSVELIGAHDHNPTSSSSPSLQSKHVHINEILIKIEQEDNAFSYASTGIASNAQRSSFKSVQSQDTEVFSQQLNSTQNEMVEEQGASSSIPGASPSQDGLPSVEDSQATVINEKSPSDHDIINSTITTDNGMEEEAINEEQNSSNTAKIQSTISISTPAKEAYKSNSPSKRDSKQDQHYRFDLHDQAGSVSNEPQEHNKDTSTSDAHSKPRKNSLEAALTWNFDDDGSIDLEALALEEYVIADTLSNNDFNNELKRVKNTPNSPLKTPKGDNPKKVEKKLKIKSSLKKTSLQDTPNSQMQSELKAKISSQKKKVKILDAEDDPNKNRVQSILKVNSISGPEIPDELVLKFLTYYDTYMRIFRDSIHLVSTATQLASPLNKDSPGYKVNRTDFKLGCFLSLVCCGVSLSNVSSTQSGQSEFEEEGLKKGVAAIKELLTVDKKEVFSNTPDFQTSSGRQKLPATMLGVLELMRLFDERGWFHEPEPESNVDYHISIKKPSDIATTKKKLLDGEFNDKHANWSDKANIAMETMARKFRRLIRRISTNALNFYEATSVLGKDATALGEVSAKMIELMCIRFGITYANLIAQEEIEEGESLSALGSDEIETVSDEPPTYDNPSYSTETPEQQQIPSKKKQRQESEFVEKSGKKMKMDDSTEKKQSKKSNEELLQSASKEKLDFSPETKSDEQSESSIAESNLVKEEIHNLNKRLEEFKEKVSSSQSALQEEIDQLHSDMKSLKESVASIAEIFQSFNSTLMKGLGYRR